ncbi:MAG: hypothetical protein K2J77_09780 [Oscillospiraceae bacterium]|nr:hypothetical protein [Oscillospiraceae bacterium]
MALFGIFKKNAKSEEERRAELLPRNKKVQFDPISIERVDEQLGADINTILEYAPVNYYAAKDSYLLCVFHFNDDYSEIYLQLEFYTDDKFKGKTKCYKIERELMQAILRKFGVNLT